MVENITQIKSGLTINVDVSAKTQASIICAKRIIFGVLIYVLMEVLLII